MANELLPHRMFHVGFSFDGPPRILDLEPTFNEIGTDWARYTGTDWLVWTTHSAREIHEALKPNLGVGDLVLIIEVNADYRTGFQKKWLWEWLDKYRSGQTKAGFGLPSINPPKLPGS